MAKKAKGEKANEGKKGGKGKLIIIVLVLLLGGGGAGYFFLFSGSQSKAAAAAAAAKLPPPMYNYPSTQPTTLSDGLHLQSDMTFQLTKASNPADISAVLPQVEDTVIQTLGAYTSSQLLAPDGKLQAKQALILALNTLLKQEPGKPQVAEIFFTQFIVAP